MFSFHVVEAEVRDFMNKLLREKVFDAFGVRGVFIVSFARFEIDGAIPEEARENDGGYCAWAEMRPYVFHIIKGRRPKTLKIVLSLPKEQAQMLHNNMSACFLNIMFDGTQILCTATASEKSFALDRVADEIWCEYITEFFKKNNIAVRL